ncbi:MAG: adenylate/guanylate cyclase domain-containing protein, partial [Chloroflexi bacterium]|nr:adenylate/guanylate cyclase domain-containing protein [Chloroflexota bacterium]
MNALPSGTVTLLFTDIEGSTQLLQRLGERYAAVLSAHHELLRACFEQNDGRVVDTQGDSFFVVFPRAVDAVNAAVQAQRALAARAWGEGIRVRVRMGLHTGEPLVQDTRYVGIDVHRASRIGAAGHGGQILLSETTYALVKNDLRQDVRVRDLGEHRLKDLPAPAPLFQIVCADLPSDFPPLKTLAARPNNLPVPLSSFIGRERELDELASLVHTTRLMTLIGAGGAGKTRLALAHAEKMLDTFSDGVWFVELARLTDAALIPQTIAATLGVRDESGNLAQTLTNYLQRKQLLLVFDNCEHLIDAAAQWADMFLRAAPQLKILATSREALNISGEHVFHVPSLPLPQADGASTLDALMQSDAARLFIERAIAATTDFQVTEKNAPFIVQICRRLDGIPLALELAAARVKALSVEQIAARLDDVFRLLSGGSRTAMPRQQTLAAAIDWSYNLLSRAERALLQRLSVFAGGWTLEAAEQVCADENLAPDPSPRRRGEYASPPSFAGKGAEGLGDLAPDPSPRRRGEYAAPPSFAGKGAGGL